MREDSGNLPKLAGPEGGWETITISVDPADGVVGTKIKILEALVKSGPRRTIELSPESTEQVKAIVDSPDPKILTLTYKING